MRYYEGHESVYKKLKDKGCSAWDEYLGQAEGFDSFCLKPFIAEMLAADPIPVKHPRALEIGCGTGPLCCFLAQNGFEAEGIDISVTAIAIACEEAARRGLSITYRAADVCRDPLPQQHYDLVVDGHCLHCIVSDEDRHRALSGLQYMPSGEV